MKFVAMLALAAGMSVSTLPAYSAPKTSPDNTLVIMTKDGEIDIQLRPDLAPNHVARIKELAREHAYDNVVFHRVIDGFMAQTGDVEFGKEGGKAFDPSRAGMGGSSKPDLKAEFSQETFDRGTVGMARAQDPNSANSQFFIMLADGDFLDGQYTIVGDVVGGMDVVDKIKKGDAQQNGAVTNPDKMLKVRVAADGK
ncbi:peptidylprolyl isomerase [Jiella endophytica]|uniref:Peptidyl-prolyl cis-trans isomerase n=1 Tax=Jiella endophytica TaxID=2558362 RepID=A0A4Y8RUX1_9HYPH|nr:peptidylprolyl isomerase [Jiella endophytica]TFF27728.1 peptidylprolyl isomerase [Jiella endophytica]